MFAVIGFDEKEKIALLMTNNPNACRNLHLETHAEYEFTVNVPLNELDIMEDRELILGFKE